MSGVRAVRDRAHTIPLGHRVLARPRPSRRGGLRAGRRHRPRAAGGGGSVRGEVSLPRSPTRPEASSTWRRRKARDSSSGTPGDSRTGIGRSWGALPTRSSTSPTLPVLIVRKGPSPPPIGVKNQLSPGPSADGARHRAHPLVHGRGPLLRPRRHGSACCSLSMTATRFAPPLT